MRDDDG